VKDERSKIFGSSDRIRGDQDGRREDKGYFELANSTMG